MVQQLAPLSFGNHLFLHAAQGDPERMSEAVQQLARMEFQALNQAVADSCTGAGAQVAFEVRRAAGCASGLLAATLSSTLAVHPGSFPPWLLGIYFCQGAHPC